MDTIHTFLTNKHAWYAGWHQRGESNTFHWMILLMYMLAATASMVSMVISVRDEMSNSLIVASVIQATPAPAAPAASQYAPETLYYDGGIVQGATTDGAEPQNFGEPVPWEAPLPGADGEVPVVDQVMTEPVDALPVPVTTEEDVVVEAPQVN